LASIFNKIHKTYQEFFRSHNHANLITHLRIFKLSQMSYRKYKSNKDPWINQMWNHVPRRSIVQSQPVIFVVSPIFRPGEWSNLLSKLVCQERPTKWYETLLMEDYHLRNDRNICKMLTINKTLETLVTSTLSVVCFNSRNRYWSYVEQAFAYRIRDLYKRPVQHDGILLFRYGMLTMEKLKSSRFSYSYISYIRLPSSSEFNKIIEYEADVENLWCLLFQVH
jgi:hypothetical protein